MLLLLLGCAPATPVVSIAPQHPTSADPLELSVEAEDGYRVEWYVDRRLAPIDGLVVAASLTTKGEQWAALVTPLRGEREGERAVATVEILNTPPQATVELVGGHAEQPLQAVASGSDLDDDPVTLGYAWYRDGELTELRDPTVISTWTANGEVWEVEVTPDDGESLGEPVRASVTIGNAPPTVDSVEILPKPPTSVDTLSAQVKVTDVDGDTVDLFYEWFVDGELASEDSTLAPLPRDHVVFVRVTPYDGEQLGEAVESDPVGIQNGAPPDPVVQVRSRSPHAGWETECVSAEDVVDPDGDALTPTELFYLDGALVQDTTGSVEGQTLSCVLKLADGQGAVVDGRDDVTVLWACGDTEAVDLVTGPGGGRVDTGDVDGDGFVDLVVGGVAWYGPDFADSEELGLVSSGAMGIGDLDGDGLPELVGADGETKELVVLWGDGTEERITQGDEASDVSVADIDGDGQPEIVMQCVSGAAYRSVVGGSVLGQSSLNALHGQLRVVDGRVAQLADDGGLWVDGVLVGEGWSGLAVEGQDLLAWNLDGLVLLEADGVGGFDECPLLEGAYDGAADFDQNGKPDAVSVVQGWEIHLVE